MTRISGSMGRSSHPEACAESGGDAVVPIKGLYEQNIVNAYCALVGEAHRAEQTLPRFTAPQFSGPRLGNLVWTPPPLLKMRRTFPCSASPTHARYAFEHVEMARRMDAVIDFVAKHQDGAKYPYEDPVGAAFCLSNGISAEDCRKIRDGTGTGGRGGMVDTSEKTKKMKKENTKNEKWKTQKK